MLKLFSPAKLNLYLEVLNKCDDGYHTISTVFERIALFDEISISEGPGRDIAIKSDSKDIPKDKRNLVYKAAALLRDDFRIAKGLTIRIKKRIPVGAGLGGGSSDAASTLLGLNRLWDLKLSRQKLFSYGGKLGADVAFFLSQSPFASGNGRGDRIRALTRFKKKLWHIIVVPRVKVSTREIYAEFDKLNARIHPEKKIRGLFFNRLEEATFRKYPRVKELKERLTAQGIRNALMSGSGGAVFGIVNSRKEGERIARIFRRDKDLRVFVVSTAL